MKKILYVIFVLIIGNYLSACTGYKPIFSSSNLEFEIGDYSIKGDKSLGKKIYSKLKNISESSKNPDAQSISIIIDVKKNKISTAKNSAGKILEYKINLRTNVVVRDFLTGNEILNQNFNSSSSYRVQDQYSETVHLENKSIEDLINKTYLDLIIIMSERINSQ